MPWRYGVQRPNGDAASDADTKAFQDCVKRIYGTKRGKQMFDCYQAQYYQENGDESNPFISVNADHGFNNGSSEDAGFGTANIRWNPDLSPTIQTSVGPFQQSPCRVLAHELGHALTGDKDTPNSDSDPGPNVRNNENPIAAGGWGEPPRTRY